MIYCIGMGNRQKFMGKQSKQSTIRKKYVGKLVRIDPFCASIHKGQVALCVGVDSNEYYPVIVLVEEQKRRFDFNEVSFLKMDGE